MSALNLDIVNWDKKKCGSIALDPYVFQQELRMDIISSIVRANQAGKRQGSHKVKTRADVRGGGAKPFRQKGTGRARQGSIRSPLLRSGGVVHGPQPRKYFQKINAKMKKIGVRTALSYLTSQSSFIVIEDMTSTEGKTKELYQRLKNFSSKALLVDDVRNSLFSRACKNLPTYQLIEAKGMNVYDLLKYDQVICTRKAVEAIHKIYGKGN